MASTVLPSLGQVRRYAGYDGDIPATAVAGSEFYSFTSGIVYTFDGENWIVEKNVPYFLKELKLLQEEQNAMIAKMLEFLEGLTAHVLT